MLHRNNPDIDFDTLNRQINDRVEQYRQSPQYGLAPVFDPSAVPQNIEVEDVLSFDELMGLEDQLFVESAYLTLLGRPADPAGLDHYLALLRSGADKSQVLASLRYSVEGRKQGVFSGRLKLAYLKKVLCSLPVIGRVFTLLVAWMGVASYRRFCNARFNHLHRVHEAYAVKLLALPALQIRLDAAESGMDTANVTLSRMQQGLADLGAALSETHAAQLLSDRTIDSLRQELLQVRIRLTSMESRASSSSSSVQAVSAEGQPSPAIEDAFYAAFEEHFRGSQAVIRQRLEYYLPLLHDTPALSSAGLPVVDIGCGRGEWLDVVSEAGFQTVGIDLNAHNISACHAKKHQAYEADALQWLTEQADASIAAVTSFHVIEHLTFAQLNQFVSEALRVLIPGGLILFETPNPENLVVGATHFHTDPTHLHPLPPAFMEFLLDYKGFADIKIQRLNPIPDEYALDEPTEVARRCNQLFYGPQDYAVVARKSVALLAEAE